MLSFISGSSAAFAGKAEISIRMAVARNPFRIVKDYPISISVFNKEQRPPLIAEAAQVLTFTYFLISFATSTPGGKMTASIAWITPFDAITSAATTVAPLTVTPLAVESLIV